MGREAPGSVGSETAAGSAVGGVPDRKRLEDRSHRFLFLLMGYNPSISLFFLVLKLSQIWPVSALLAGSGVLLKYLHDFLRNSMFSGTI